MVHSTFRNEHYDERHRLAFVGRSDNDPFERFDRQGNPIEPVFGPTLTLLFDEESCYRGKVRDVILLVRRSRGREEGKGEDEPAAAASADEIHKASEWHNSL